MNARLGSLSERRSRLVREAEAQRTRLAREMQPWRGRLALADQGMLVFRYMRNRSAWLIAPVLLIAALRPRFFGLWIQRGWTLWQIGRRLSRPG